MLDEQERQRIADRLRGGPAQALANLAVELRTLLQMMDAEMGELQGGLKNALREAEDGLRELREIIEDLHPPLIFRELGFLAWVDDFARRTSQSHGLDVRVETPDTMPSLRPEVASVLLRVVQEAVRNVVKHAGATEVVIRLYPDLQDLVLEVEDDGLGVDPEQVKQTLTGLQPKETFGLTMMQEWAQRVSGTLTMHTKEERGTVVRLRVPKPWKEEP